MKKMNERLPSQPKRNKWIFAAASVLFVITVTITSVIYLTDNSQYKITPEGPLSDLELFYSQQLQHCIQAIRQSGIDEADKLKMIEELTNESRIAAREMTGITEEQVMTEFYERKVSMLSFLMDRIENINQLKKQ
jgi:hypothetical protein